jgi:hypothetical protein
MKRWIPVLVTGVICASMGALAAAPAQAVTVKNRTAPLLDAGGVDSGCTATVFGGPVPGPTQGPMVGSTGYLKIQTDLYCSHRWRAYNVTVGWQPVIRGKRGASYPAASTKGWMANDQVPSADPFGASTSNTINPCLARSDGLGYDPGTSNLPWLLPLGNNDVIFKGTAKVNEFKADLHPYQAAVEHLLTVRCTSARAAYR